MLPGGAFGEVNDAIRRLAPDGPVTEMWEFFCECHDADCHTMVSLTLREFDDRRTSAPPQPILAARHAVP